MVRSSGEQHLQMLVREPELERPARHTAALATRAHAVGADEVHTAVREAVLVMSLNRCGRSSASTSTRTVNGVCWPVQLTWTMRCGSDFSRLRMLTQSARWTDTPCALVMNPTILSPGTGLQQRASLTHTPETPLTVMAPEAVWAGGSGAVTGTPSASMSSLISCSPASPTRWEITVWAVILPSPSAEYRLLTVPKPMS